MVTTFASIRYIRHWLLLTCLWLGVLAPAAEIVLPIEVLGPSGTTRTVTVTSSALATALSLRIHGLAHGNTGEVRVDSGAWIALSNTTATVAGMAARFGGVGMFPTLDLRVPITATPAGSHTVSFRFANGDGLNMGFRVLRLDLLTADGQSTVAASTFRNEDPATWTPPLTGTAARDAGETLWRTASLIEGNGGPSINAHCSDCHAQDGRDLSYFNYSNLSIIERSKFHGLSDTEANQIASYIRSLPGSVHGRPWNPPYQPGPGLTSRPVSEWAAGAGIDAVTMEDADAIVHVPGATGNAREIIDEDGRIQDMPIHDMPMAFQLLDWNHWLPRVHPLDAPGFDFTTSGAKIEYDKLRTVLSGSNPTDELDKKFVNGEYNYFFNKWRDEWYPLERNVTPEVNWAGISNGSVARVFTPGQANRIYGANLWGVVKLWELMQEFSLEGHGKVMFGATSPERLWYSHRFVFDSSPFLSGLPEGKELFGDGPGAINYDYVNNSWYQLQLQLNAGQGGRSSGGHGTIDWGYMNNHFGGMFNATKEGEPIRKTIFALMSMQQHDSGLGPEFSGDGNPNGKGWDFVSIPSLVSTDKVYWKGVANPKPLIQAVLQAVAEKNARFTPAQWRQAKGHDGYNMPASSYVLGTDQGEAEQRNQGERYLDLLMDARNAHPIDEPIINGLAAVGALILPNNDWTIYRRATAAVVAPATCTARSGIGSIQITWAAVPNATSYNLYRAVSASGPFAPIRLMTTDTTATDRRLTPGSWWYYYVSANIGGAEGPSHSPIASTGVARGLVARWAFDESGKKVLDASGLRNHGELVGAVQRVSGKHGSAIRMTGKGQFASLTYDMLPVLRHGATVTAWVRSSAAPTEYTYMSVLGGSRYFGLVCQDPGDGRPRVKVWDGEVKGTTSVVDGRWHHLAMSHAADDVIQVWVDGVLEGSSRLAAHPDDQTRIGDLGRGLTLNHADTTWLGDLDDIRIYDQALSASEIRAVMDDTSAGPTTAMEADADFHPGAPEAPTAVDDDQSGGKGCGLGGGLAILFGTLALSQSLGRRRHTR